MKTLLALTSALLALAPSARAAQSLMTVIAERTQQASALPQPGTGQPVTYVAYDGGYIEAGDPIAGDRPPSADTVRRGLASALQAAGYAPAAGSASASVLIVYHWGSIRKSTTQIRRPYHINPNLRARIALVALPRTVDKAERYFSGPRPPVIEPDLRDAFDLSRDPRYFVIVSAYRYNGPDQSNPVLFWRTRLSAQENAGGMDEVIPALLAAGGPYLGRDLADRVQVKIPISRVAEVPSAAMGAQPTMVDSPSIAALARREHGDFAGETDPADVH